jgi:Flp pilus assembly protein TadD
MSDRLKLSAALRGIMIHDGVAFLILLLVSIVLYAITALLFRSFEDHRAGLAVRWAERGREALAANRPAEAIDALHTALSYAPDDRPDQLLLAQALAASPQHIDEATNYFLNLWEQTPGDGFINLQLARLARRRGDTQNATNYYRAAIFGSWEGDGPARRRDVRRELADYLIEQHDFTEARSELFITVANNPQDEALALGVSATLARTGDLNDALLYAEKAANLQPHDRAALAAVGQYASALGDFSLAYRSFERAAEAAEAARDSPAQSDLNALAQHARRTLELSLSRDLPQSERLAHLEVASVVAQGRLDACIVAKTPATPAQEPASPGTPSAAGPTLPAALASLKSRWTASLAVANRRLIRENADAQDARAQLIYQTEQDTAKLCSPASGDDAILLMLAGFAGRRNENFAAGHGR